jgi:hypothetical protein
MSKVHMKYTDKNGASRVAWHSVWNEKLFIETQQAAHLKEEGTAEVITEAHYRAVKRVERRSR